MESLVALDLLNKLGVDGPQACMDSLQDGATSLLPTASGATLALLRRGNTYDSLLVGNQSTGSVFPLRAVLENAFLPMSERYASKVGVASPQRDAIRKRIREAAVALGVIASGRLVSVHPPDFPVHPRLKSYVTEDGFSSVDQLPEKFANDLTTLNQLQANVVAWSKEVDRIVHISRKGPGAVLTAEEETVFWSSLDAALSTAEKFIVSPVVKMSLDILARKRRATGFLIETSVTLANARRNSAAVLTLVQGLPLVALRSADSLTALKDAVVKVLDHIASKIRGSSFSVDRSLSLIHAMGDDVTRSMSRILSGKSNLLTIPYEEVTNIINQCCELFEAWSHGFDTCRQVVREAARVRGEAVPPRTRTGISKLYDHLTEIYELRADQHSLRSLLTQLLKEPSHSSPRIEKLDVAYNSLLETSRTVDHFKMSEQDETKWLDAVNAYRKLVKQVESMACSDYIDIVERSTELTTLANVITPFTAVADKHFMSSCVEEALPYVLRLAAKELKLLQTRERLVNSRDVKRVADGMPVICVVLFECLQICTRATAILEHVEAVVGKTRMRVMPDLNDFIGVVQKLENRVQPATRLTEWLTRIRPEIPDGNIFHLIEDSSGSGGGGGKRITVNMNIQIAYFSSLYSMKVMFPKVPISRNYGDLSRFTSKIHPVYTDLRQSLKCYDMVIEHLKTLEEHERGRLFPFVFSMLQEGESIMQKGFELRWNSENLVLSNFASDLLKHCSLLYSTYQLILENDEGIQAAIEKVDGLFPVFDGEHLSEELLNSLKAEVFDTVGGHRDALLAVFPQEQVDEYLKNNWHPNLHRSLSKLFARTIHNFFRSLSTSKISSLQISATVVQQDDEAIILCVPSIPSAEQFMFNSTGELFSSFRDVLETGFVHAGVQADRAHVKTLQLLGKCSSGTSSTVNQCKDPNPFQVIARETERVVSLVEKLEPYVQFVQGDPGSKLDENTNDGDQTAFSALSRLSRIHESVLFLQKNWDSSKSEDAIISVDSTILCKKILSNIKECIRERAESCGNESALLSQTLYQRISDANQTLQNLSSTDMLKVVVSLQGLREDLLPSCKMTLENLMEREQIFEKITNNILRSSSKLIQSTESWVRSTDLKPYLEDLESSYEQRSMSAMKDKKLLLAKYEDMRKQYQTKMATIFADFQNIRGKDCSTETYLGLEELLQDLQHQLQALENDALNIKKLAKALDVEPMVDMNGPRGILDELKRLRESLERLGQIHKQLGTLGATIFVKADMSDIETSLKLIQKDVDEISLHTGNNREAQRISTRLSKYLKQLPLLRALHSVELSPPRERDVLKTLFGDADRKEGLQQTLLGILWDLDILAQEEYLKNVFEVAAGEALICDFLRDVERKWSVRKCQFLYRGDIPLMQGLPSIIDELEEHMQALDTMKASSHAKLFESERSAWEKRLALAHERLELMADVQSRWAHLRTLFGSRGSSSASVTPLGDLHEEISSFANVHARFSSIGMMLSNAPGLIEGLEADLGLEDMQEELKGIVRGLSRFLEKQRTQFPRFFFLSDDDLLHVLSVSPNNVEGLQPHVSKLFPGLAKITFENIDGSMCVLSAESSEGELINFSHPIYISEKSVVSWLHDVQSSIRAFLKKCLKKSVPKLSSLYGDPSKSADTTLEHYRGSSVQIIILALRVCFTEEVDLCLDNASSAALELKVAQTCIERNLSTVCSVRYCPENMGMSHRVFLLLRDQLIKEFVYQRDLVIRLQSEDFSQGVSHVWHNELRFYVKSGGGQSDDVNLSVKCSCASFNYGWEYLGVGDALVRTELTSRCYLVLTEALRRGFGGSPFGPAGTGKTETVKALGKAMGRFVSVFNCDESFDSVSVGRILAGACRIGCWVCFDEFNRLSSSSLSSTSGQLAALQDAVKRDENEIPNFYGGDFRVKVTQGFAIFVTMNPTYSGRRELPANLKSLFRPCAMSKPDTQPIAEVLLLSENFRFSTVLSEKLITLFSALQSSLSEQCYYDFGLRALKSTIIACGSILASLSGGEQAESRSVGQEEDVIVRGVGEVLKPKLDADDVSDYEHLVMATFSEASGKSSLLPADLESSIDKLICERRLVRDDVFLDKIKQLFALLQHHCGVMMIGSTGTGKSTVWRVLYDAMKSVSSERQTNSSDKVKSGRTSLTVIDAKLLSAYQLYGSLDTLTREWTDGLFTKVLRSIAENRTLEPDGSFPLHWIVFDGDVDPDWIETLNSVLDDNRILTLPSGEQIPFLPNTRIIFESDNLGHANPSSVSRCGMVCFGDYSFVLPSFMSKLGEIIKDCSPSFKMGNLVSQLARLTYNLAVSVLNRKSLVMEVSLHSLLSSFLILLRNTLESQLSGGPTNRYDSESTVKPPSLRPTLTEDLVIKTVLTCIIKAVGSGQTNSARANLSTDLLNLVRDIPEVENALQGVVASCLADVAVLSNGDLLEYSELLGQGDDDRLQRDIASPDVVIPTPTTIRLEHLLRDALNLSSKKANPSCPLILCGPPGSGKSMILMSALRETPNVSLATLSFSSETTPANILTSLKGHTAITKRPNGNFVLQPKSAGCRVILFCDEVNLEKPDRYETQTSVALLRSLAQLGGFWTGSPPHWVSIEGVQIVAACNPSDDAGRHQLAPRFLRHCFVVRVEEPTPTDLRIIYGNFNGSMLKRLNPRLAGKNEMLTSSMVEFYARNKEKFSPSGSGPIEAHYIYSPRDLSRWSRGMSMLLSATETNSLVNESLSEQDKEAVWMDVIRAFCYEARRLFRDRLVRQEDRVHVENQLLAVLRSFMKTNLHCIPEFLYTSWMGSEDAKDAEGRRFQAVEFSQDFRSMIYEKLRVFSEEQGLGGTYIGGMGEVHEEENNTVDQFAVTDDVLTHLTRIERILCQPLGHAVLMGAPGTGKKTLARFAAWMLSIEVHQVRSHSAYTEQEFAKDLRDILRRASINNCQMLMIFDESHAMETAFLEMMNSLLACGEVPGLFSGDERVRLFEDLRQVSSQSLSTEQSLYSEFVRRIRHNLHIIFTVSLVSPNAQGNNSKRSRTLSDLSRRSPALYNRCTVDWVGDWSRETLAAVAELKLDVLSRSESELEKISRCAVEIHEVATDFVDCAETVAAVTPRHYLEFIEQFNRIVLEKGGAIEKGVDRYKQGVSRLRAAGEAVEDLKEELGAKAEDLRIKEIHANEMLQKMVEEQGLAEKSKVEAEQLAAAAEEASHETKLREEEVAVQLSEALPKIESAREAVGMIRKENLEELRAMPNPPEPVRIALEAVIMMLDGATNRTNAQLTWSAIRGRMRGSEFISSVVSFDGATLSKAMRAKITKRIIQNPSFDVVKISYASRAAGPLAQWTLAVMDFLDVHDSVEPLQQEISKLQVQQAGFVDRQEAALDEAYAFKQRIEECRAEYARLVSEAERIRQDITESETNLDKAEKMLDSLGEEWSRWIRDMKILNASADTVWGDSVFAAAFIAYAGPLDYINRIKLSSAWRKIILKTGLPFDQAMSVAEYLTTAEQRGIWSTNGLPTDVSSLENYAILRRSARFPLIVDPTRGCSELLQYVLRVPGNSDETSTNSDEMRIAVSSFSATGKKSYIRALESAVRFGTVIILEDAERYDRAVTPLLGQEVFFGDNEKQDGIGSERGQSIRRGIQKFTKNVCQRVVRLGDRDVFLNSNFCMFLAAADLQSVPRAAITRANVVSFELSAAALGTTCVSRSLKLLAPEVEQRRSQSLSARNQFEHRKRILEEKVLSAVNNVDDLGANLLSGPLLDDLSCLKQEVHIINERQKEEELASEEIKEKESQFEPLGRTAVNIFSVIQSLSSLNTIYRFNTELFLNLFDSAITRCVVNHNNSKKVDDDEPISLKSCQRTLLEHTLTHIVSSLFPRDRLSFAAALVLVSFREGLSIKEENEENGRINKIRNACFESLSRLEKMMKGQQIQSIQESISSLPQEIKYRFNDNKNGSNENTNRDNNNNNQVWESTFEILERSLHTPEQISTAVEKLACLVPECQKVIQGTNSGSEEALRGALVSFARTRKSNNNEVRFRPLLLCVQGDSCDPAASTVEFANDSNILVMSLAMGSSISDDMVSNAIGSANRKCDEGKRVVLLVKNMHLASKSALNRIHGEVSKFKGCLPCLLIIALEISSDYAKHIVLSLSSFFHLLAFESPPSFRTNFNLSCEKVSNFRIKNNNNNNGDDNDNVMRRLGVLISWLHASVLERCLHVPVGFTKAYDFSENDLSAGCDVLIGLLSNNKQNKLNKLDISSIAYMLSSCVYGCRVENDHDHEIIHALVNGLFNFKQLNENDKAIYIDDKKQIIVPTGLDGLNGFIQNMPVHADAGWCKMPADTAVIAQRKDGADVLRKLLILSNDKFSNSMDNDEKLDRSIDDITQETNDENNNAESMISELYKTIPDEIEDVTQKGTASTSLSRFVDKERRLINKILKRLKNNLEPVDECMKEECTELSNSGTRSVPSQWHDLLKLLNNNVKNDDDMKMNFGEFMNRLKANVKMVSLLNVGNNFMVDMRAIIRPQAMVTALRYEEAERRNVSPHRLYAVVLCVSRSHAAMKRYEGVSARLIRGLKLVGAEWDEENELFKVCASGSCTTDEQEEYLISWMDKEDDKYNITIDQTIATGKKDTVSIGVQGRNSNNGRSTTIWTVNLVVCEGNLTSQWRLNGSKFFVPRL